MLSALSRNFLGVWLKLRRLVWRRPRPKLVVKGLKRLHSKIQPVKRRKCRCRDSQDDLVNDALTQRTIRLASFNVALFSLAPAVPTDEKPMDYIHEGESDQQVAKSIVSINLPENETQSMMISVADDSAFSFDNDRAMAPVRSPISLPAISDWSLMGRNVLDVLKEVDADILALQDVKAVEENDMEPLSDLARALDMNYVFAESWAPEYGNAVLSKWPIKRCKVQKICDDRDFRNVVKATIDVPWSGELNFYCTQLDHLDENWRMKQINALIESNDQPHLLAGGLNSLDASDYSSDRWNGILKYYEELGKPAPKVEVTSLLKQRHYADAKNFPDEHEPSLVMTAQGQNTQGTCKYGTRVDYILGSPGLDYTFVPGSYSVYSSKGTSDHHIVKVDITRSDSGRRSRQKGMKQRHRGSFSSKL